MTESFIVVYDACVLYPMILRDLLLRLAVTDLFRAKWTNQIHDEWIKNVLKNRTDLSREKLERTRALMNENAFDPLVTGYDHLIPKLSLPDPDDRHVLAAAIQAKASTIVTFNLKDFPTNILSKYQIEAFHPDDFIQLLAEIDLNVVLNSAKIARTSLKKPPIGLDEYLGILMRHEMDKTVSLFKEHELSL